MALDRKTLLFCIFLFTCTFGCRSSNSNYHSSQWDIEPDGSRYIYAVDGRIWEVRNRALREKKEIAEGESPCYVGDSNKILYIDEGSVRLYDSELRKSSQITFPTRSANEQDMQVAYDSASKRVFFNRFTAGGITESRSFDLYSCNLDGSDPVPITKLKSRSLRLSTKPFFDHSVYFVTADPASGYVERIAKVDLGARLSQSYVFPGEQTPWVVSVSKQGKVVESLTGGADELHVLDIATSAITDRKVGDGVAEWPLFSPNGSSVLYLRHDAGAVQACSVALDGRVVTLFPLAP